MNLANEATNANGNALANQEKYMDSMAGKIQSIKTKIEEFWITLYNDSAVNEVLDKVDNLLTQVNEALEKYGSGTIVAGGAIGTVVLSGIASALKTGIPELLTSIGMSFGKSFIPSLAAALSNKATAAAASAAFAPTALAIGTAVAGIVVATVGAVIYQRWKKNAEIKKLQQEALDSALKSGKTDVLEQTNSLEKYTQQIKELRDVMNASTTTEEEYIEAKEDLLSLQDQLNDYYGTESDQLDLVNGKYQEQIELLEKLSKEKMEHWGYNDAGVNEKGERISNADKGQEAYNAMYGNSSFDLVFKKGFLDGLTDGISQYITEEAETKWQTAYKGSRGGSGLRETGNTVYKFDFEGKNADEIIEILSAYRENLVDIADSSTTDSDTQARATDAIKKIDEQLDSYRATSDQYSEMLKTYDVWRMRSYSGAKGMAASKYSGSDLYFDFQDAASKYSTALASGDSEAIENAKAEYDTLTEKVETFTSRAGYEFDYLFEEIINGVVNAEEDAAVALYKSSNEEALTKAGKYLFSKGLRSDDLTKDKYDHSSAAGRTADYWFGLAKQADIAKDDLISILCELVPEFKALGDAVEIVNNKTMAQGVSSVDTATEKADAVSKIIDSMKKRGDSGINNDEMKTIYDTFGGTSDLGEAGIEPWLVKLEEARGSAEETEKVLSELMTTWAGSKDFLGGATGAVREYIKDGLENAGFTLGELSDEQVEFLDTQYATNQAMLDGGTATAEEIKLLQAEAEQVGIGESQWLSYYLAKFDFSNTLDFTSDLNKLATVNSMLNLGIEHWIQYYQARNGQLTSQQASEEIQRATGVYIHDPTLDEKQKSVYDNYVKEHGGDLATAGQYALQQNMQKEWDKKQEDLLKVSFDDTPNGWDRNKNKNEDDKSGSGSSSDLSEKEYDWVKTKLEAVDRERQKYKDLMDSQFVSFEEKQAVSGGNYDKTKQFLKKYQNEVTKYQSQFDNMYSTLTSKFGESFAQKISEDVKNDKGAFGDWMEEYIKAHPKTGVTDSQYAFLEKYESVYYDLIEAQEKLTDVQQNGYYDSESGINSMLGAYQEYIDVLKQAKELYDARWEVSKQLIRENASALGYGDNPDELINKIMNGDITLENWHDEYTTGKKGELSKALQEVMDDAIEDYSLVAESEEDIRQAEEDYMEALLQSFEIRVQETEHAINKLSSAADRIQSAMNIKTTTGSAIISKSDYQQLISNADSQIEQLEKQKGILREEADELEEDSDAWYEVQEQIQSCNAEIDSLRESQAEWNEEIKQIPIKLLTNYLNVLDQMQQHLASFIELQTALGKNASSDYYVESIDLANVKVQKLMEQQKLYQQQLEGADAYAFGTDKYDEVQSAIAEIDSEIASAIQSMAEWNQTIAQMPVDKLTNYLEVLENSQSTLQSYISMMQARGKVVDDKQYQTLIDSGMAQLDVLTKEKAYLTEMLKNSGYEEGSEKYQELVSQINSVDSAISSTVSSIDEWNEAIQNLPLQKLQQWSSQLENYQSLINGNISQTEKKGKVADSSDYKLLLETANARLKVLNEQKKLLLAQQSNYEVGSDKYNELADQINSVDSSIQSVVSDTIDWSQALLEIPIEKITQVDEDLDLIIEAYDKLIGEYDQVLSAVSAGISNQIDLISDEMELTEEMYDEQIEAIQDVIDKLNQQNEARQKLLAVEDAQYDLEKAQNNKSVAIIDESGHKQYVADQEAVRDAQQELEDAQYEYQVYTLEEQIRMLEEQKEEELEAYQDQIDALNEQAEAWEKITKNITEAKDAATAAFYLGEDWLAKVLSGDDHELMEYIKKLYEEADKAKTETEDVKNANEDVSKVISEYVNKFMSGEISMDEAVQKIAEASQLIGKRLDANEYLDLIKTLVTDAGGGTAPIDQAKDTTAAAIQELIENIQYVYEKNQETDRQVQPWEKTAASIGEGTAQLSEAISGQDWASYVARIEAAVKQNDAGVDKFVVSWETISAAVEKQTETISNYLNSSEWQQYVQNIITVFNQNNAIMAGYLETWQHLQVSLDEQYNRLNTLYDQAKKSSGVFQSSALQAGQNSQETISDRLQSKSEENGKASFRKKISGTNNINIDALQLKTSEMVNTEKQIEKTLSGVRSDNKDLVTTDELLSVQNRIEGVSSEIENADNAKLLKDSFVAVDNKLDTLTAVGRDDSATAIVVDKLVSVNSKLDTLTSVEKDESVGKLLGDKLTSVNGKLDTLTSVEKEESADNASRLNDSFSVIDSKLDTLTLIEKDESASEVLGNKLTSVNSKLETLTSVEKEESADNANLLSDGFSILDGKLDTLTSVEKDESASETLGNKLASVDGKIGSLLSTTQDEKYALLESLSVKPLTEDELPSILKSGAMFNLQEQNATLFDEVRKISSGALGKVQQAVNNITLNMSNLTFNEISNGQDFANYITTNLSSAIAQNLGMA